MVHSSKPQARRSSHLLSRYPTMCAEHLRIFVGPMCTFDPQQSEDKVQMTAAQRRTRFRCLRRSRRRLGTLSAEDLSNTKTHEQNRLNRLAKNCVRQHSESTQTLAQHCERKRLAKQTPHSHFEIHITSGAQ